MYTFRYRRITEDEISQVIKGLKSNKARGINMMLIEYRKSILYFMSSK